LNLELKDMQAPREREDTAPQQTFLQIIKRFGGVKIGKCDAQQEVLVLWKDSPSGWQCWARPDASHEYFAQVTSAAPHVVASARCFRCSRCGSNSPEALEALSAFEDDHMFCEGKGSA
jgi:hypothetical protein